MLKVANLDVSIGPIPIIRSASLDLNEGEMCGLIGRNGAGKTTLLRAIMGAIAATGSVRFGDAELLSMPAHGREALEAVTVERRPHGQDDVPRAGLDVGPDLVDHLGDAPRQHGDARRDRLHPNPAEVTEVRHGR